jgi:hypothetical protein
MSFGFLKSGAFPFLAALLVTASGLSGRPAPAAAQAPSVSPSEMMEHGQRNLEIKLAELLPKVTDARTALAAIREFNDIRRLAQRVVAMDYPLDDFTGILLVDSYDERYAAAIDTIGVRFLSLDQTLPPVAAAVIFRDRLGDLPQIGDTPAGFVVAFVIGRCAAAATGLPDTLSSAMRDGVTEIAVRAIAELAHNYMATRMGEARQKSDDFWHLSVIQRLRCAEHASGYTMQEERNGLKLDGSLYRRYVVKCDKGGETRKLDFDLGAMGALTQTGGRQNLRKAITNPGARKPGVDP